MKLTKEEKTQFIKDAIEYLHEIGIEVENITEIEIISIKNNKLNNITEVKFRYKNHIVTKNVNYWNYYLLKEKRK